MAVEHQAELLLVHVVDSLALDALKTVFIERPDIDQELLAGVQRALDALARDAGQLNIPVTTAVRVGAVVAELLAAAISSDLLVMGAHGVNALRDRIVGTTAERLLGKCRIPIIVARQEVRAAYKRLLVPVDLSGYSAPAMAAASRIAPHAAIHLLHVYDVPFEGYMSLTGVADSSIQAYRLDIRAQALRDLQKLVRTHLPMEPKPLVSVERGGAAFKIIESALEDGADLIVIGKQGQSAIGDFLLGSVTRHVLANAECDLLVVPRKDSGL